MTFRLATTSYISGSILEASAALAMSLLTIYSLQYKMDTHEDISELSQALHRSR